MVLGKLDSHLENIKLNPYPIPYTILNSKWIRVLDVKDETIQLLEDNTCKFPFNPEIQKGFLNPEAIKENIGNLTT